MCGFPDNGQRLDFNRFSNQRPFAGIHEMFALGCDIFQGYLYGKPMTPDQLEEDIRAGRLLLQHDNFSRAPQIELADSGQWRTHTADPQATLDLQKKPPEIRHS